MLSKKVLTLAAASLFSTGGAVANDALTLGDGLLVDAANGQVVLMREGGGLEQVNIASGKASWVSDAADRPVMLLGGELTAQVDTSIPGRMDLRLLDANSGTEKSAFAVELPADVRPSIDDGLGQTFTMRPSSGSKAGLVWRYEKRLVQGAFMADAPKPTRHTGLLSPESGSWKNRPISDAESRKAQEALAATQPNRPIAGVEGRQFSAVNGSHVLVSLHQPEQQLPYRWQVFDAAGNPLGETRSRMSFSPFVVLDGTLLYVSQPYSERQGDGVMRGEGLTLRAMDLTTGKQRWQKTIRDTRYTGPYPT
ncbi:MAG: hypothetical protein AAF358_07775 [Pseudomonadota bacterium]